MMSLNTGVTVRKKLNGLLISAFVALAAGGAAHAGNLTNTPVTGDQFAAAFDLTMHTAFIETKFKLADGEAEGVLRSEVFAGKGVNAGKFAYLYQIMAPGQTDIADFIIDGFNKNLLTTANVKNPNDSSIYLTDLGTDGKIDKFTVVGTVAPARVFVSDLGSDGVLIDYTGGKIPAGGTGYIVGIFSERRPRIDRGVAVNGKLVDVEFFTAVPEPGSFCLLAIGAGAVVGIRTILQRRARGRPGSA